jgi:Replication-relaxation
LVVHLSPHPCASLFGSDLVTSATRLVEAPPRRRSLGAVRYEHLMVAKWLDRFGSMTTEQLRRAVLPDATLRAAQDLLRRMRDAGLVERRRVQLSIEEGRRRRGGSTPRLYVLTPAGYRLGQRSPGIRGSVIPGPAAGDAAKRRRRCTCTTTCTRSAGARRSRPPSALAWA